MVTVRACDGAERAEAIALLDEEFIASRGRAISLSARFPAAFTEPAARLLAIREGGRIAAALLLRPFAWLAYTGRLRGAMVGMVCTRGVYRGRGLGAALMTEVAELLRTHTDFGVLWTTRPDFYARFGWLQADAGMLGRVRCGGDSEPMRAAHFDALLPEIHALREAQGGERVERSTACYRTLIPQAAVREALVLEDSYAVVGRAGATGYVCDLGGDNAGFPGLYAALRRRYRELVLNLASASPAHRWFASQPEITWSGQSLAMWLPLSGAVQPQHLERWYVPLLDRI